MTRFLPILPLRDIVVFPHRIVPLFVGREKSVAALEAAMAADKELFLVAQLDPGEDDPDRDALYDLGVVATAMQLLKLPDGTVRVLVEGVKRARLVNLESREGYTAAEIEEVEEEGFAPAEAQALMRSVIDQFATHLRKRWRSGL
jgi:ATP-dependent Lon protease